MYNKPLGQNPHVLSEMDIQIIKAEYAKKATNPDKVDYEKIDKLVMRLKFFSKLSKSVRMSLLRQADYIYYESGSTIFKQGDYGDLMYVILRGSVNVRVKKRDFYGTIQNVIAAVLYDGTHFGELALMGTATQKKSKGETIVYFLDF